MKLTTPQNNIWNLQKFYENTSIQNICGAVIYNELLDRKLLEQAVNEEIRLQSGLRLRFCEENGVPVQYIADYAYSDIEFMEFDSEAAFNAYAEQFALQPFALENSQMYRIVIFEVCGKSGVLVCASHLVSDAWTYSLLARDIYNICKNFETKESAPFPEYSYVSYIESEQAYLSSDRYEKDKAYWTAIYPDKPEPSPIKMLQMPIKIPTAARYTKNLTAEQTSRIDVFCKNSGITQAVLFEAAMFAYLKKINRDNSAVTIGMPVLNRSNAREKNTVGMFISTMPLTVSVSEEDTAVMLCKRITDRHKEIFRHMKYPYSHILQSIREKSEFTGNLYDVMVSYQNAQTNTNGKTRWFSNCYSEVPLALHIDNRDSSDTYTLTLDYQTEVFRQGEEIALLTERILYIIEQIISDSEITVGELSVLPAAEYQKVIYDFNDTAVDYPKDKCVHQLFEEQAARKPDKIALYACDRNMTFSEIVDEASAIANSIIDKGIEENSIIGIMLPRQSTVISSMFGVLKSGCAYMPIAADYPIERARFMLQDTCAKMVITTNELRKNFTDICTTVSVDELLDNGNLINKNRQISLDDPFVVLHTSGSTGTPKMAILSHLNVLNFRNATSYLFERIKQTLSTTIITFDAFVQESMVGLSEGVPLVLFSENEIFNEELFEKKVCQFNHSFIFQTPTKILNYIRNSVTKDFLTHIDTFEIGGEKFPLELFELIHQYNNNNTVNIYGPTETLVMSTNKYLSVFNGYGPTETTVASVYKPIQIQDDISLGKPIANTQVYILDSDRKPLPIGVAGELCISGDGVGAGYLNRPELTAEKFIPNPFIEGKIMYCTGDLARWRTDGELEYLGRIDTQVKIRGLRIELGEIESVMSTFEGVQLCAVTDKRDEDDRQYLVGYYTAEKEVDEKALRSHLAAKLPKYMIPNYFMRLDEIPMTASGKTDRKNLPLPDFTANQTEFIAPETETEIKIAKIWEKLLKLENIGLEDDFFDLGGDSLLSISLLAQLEAEFDIEMSMKDIMEHSVLKDMSACIERANARYVKITAHNDDKYVLLPQQKTIYAVCSKNPDTLTYNMPAFIPLSDEIDREKIKSCFRDLLNTHRSLKTYIKAENGDIYGIYDENAELVFEEYQGEDYVGFVRPFDLSKAPLVRVAFTDNGMLVDMHHIISDGEGLNIILRDLATLYNNVSVAAPEIQYSDYAEYFISADFAKHREYFKNMLKCDFEPVVLPENKGNESGGVSAIYNISKAVFDAGREYAHKNGLTDTMLYLGAFGILLSKYSAKSDILSSIILTNRTHSETAGVVGMFVNTLPIYLSTKGKTKDYFAAVKELVLNLYEYQELPFFEIAQTVKMDDITAVNTSFVYQADGEKRLSVGGTSLAPEFIDTHTAKFDLSFELTPNENGCALRIEYNCGKYDSKLIDRLFASYIRIIEQLSSDNIADINVLSDEEYKKVIYDFNDTAVDYPKEKCVHQLFEEQAAKTPDKIALYACDRNLTFSEIVDEANVIANSIINKGIVKNSVIGIMLPRQSTVVSSMFAVLKSGCAYMPIAADYPIERVRFMLKDSGAKMIITTYELCKLFSDICISISVGELTEKNNSNSYDCITNLGDPFVVLHTSGSTGKPKMAVLTHKNLLNIRNAISNFFDGITQVISSTIITFDAFIEESIIALSKGISLVLLDENTMTDIQLFENEIQKYNNSFMFQTPTKLLNYIKNSKTKSFLSSIKTFDLGGEIFPIELYEEIREYSDSIYNSYGPTETTLFSTCHRVITDEITIGKPIANTQIYILDSNRKPLPIGVAGELCISGDGVGAGYLNRPELTAEKFIPNPFIAGKTMYCTGDLARWREDGEIEYLGRIDTQVKIRGLRIELGEIESVMSTFEGIRLCAVTDKRDENGRQYLVGYYTAEKEVDEKALRSHLAAKLPKYMIPNYFMRLNEMPMTASGKTDRKNLPLPDFTANQTVFVAPETELETALCDLLSEMLNLEQVGVTDDFFKDLGGDSLRAIEYVAIAADAGVHFSVSDLFRYPNIHELCENIKQKESLANDNLTGVSSTDNETNELVFQVEKVTEKITRIKGFCGEMMYLVEGSEKSVLIDTGCGFGSLKRCVDQITNKPVIVLLSHGHMDHAMGAVEFDQVYMCRKDNCIFEAQGDKSTRLKNADTIIGAKGFLTESNYMETASVANFYDLHEGDMFDIGGETLEVFACPGHTPGSVAILIQNERILFLGDACNDLTFLYEDHSLSVSEYSVSLSNLKHKVEDRFDRVLTSHRSGEVSSNVIDTNIEVCDNILNRKSDDIPIEIRDCKRGYIAKATTVEGRTDGKVGNIIYWKK